ncbi:Uncharacterised protein [Staphylococcus aureus]|nr:Uncharacterised protein [Staphylococcus aureus]
MNKASFDKKVKKQLWFFEQEGETSIRSTIVFYI